MAAVYHIIWKFHGYCQTLVNAKCVADDMWTVTFNLTGYLRNYMLSVICIGLYKEERNIQIALISRILKEVKS